MATKFVHRCTSALTVVMIVILLAVIIFVWMQFSPSIYKNKQQYKKFNITTATNGNEIITPKSSLHSKDYNESFSKQEDTDSELVKPIKISPPQLTEHDIIYDKLHNYHGKPPLRHHSGHFRHKTAEIWDPHPSYEIDAFGHKFIIDLENNGHFVPEDLHITTHVHETYTKRIRHDPKMNGCFYTGKVQGDAESGVAVSLCNGMTGHIKTSDGNYYIYPEKASNNTIDSFWHIMRRVSFADKENNVFDYDYNASDEVVDDGQPHIISKRSLVIDDIDTDTKNGSFYFDEVRRRTREVDSASFGKRNNQYFIKLLVVADKTMTEYHETDSELTHYILTLMSHVALIFKDATIGNAIAISVVHIWILNNSDFSNSNSGDTLKKFCDWQHKNTLTRSHDAALLLTRNTICKNTSAEMCSTLGLAQVGSMCRPASGCAVVRDKGLSSSYIIAHEIGHLLSMPHDDDKRCNKYNKGKNYEYIMSKMMLNDTKPWIWSNCSKHYVTEFLESNGAKCLLNPPKKDFLPHNLYENRLPGEIFEVDRQCELVYGTGSKICSYMAQCGSLWCTAEQGEQEGCRSSQFWAEGTPCGYHGWCHHGECKNESDRSLFLPVEGGWGVWQPWNSCSRTCGGGIKMSKRACDNPVPRNGGAYCTGHSVRYSSCNTEDCDSNDLDFRSIQCAEFNGNTFNIPNLTNDVEWIPKYPLDKPEDYCRLSCRPKTSNAYYIPKEKVIDGTKCGLNSFDICVNGICRKGGCDNKLNSEMVLDECGICGGDNSRCEEITGSYNISEAGYNRVTRIPKGSSNLDIRQKTLEGYDNDSNYLALVDGETGKYILNGDYMAITLEADVVFGSLIIKYSGSYARIERITTPKNHKLAKDLVLEVLCVGNVTPPDISYRYVISQDNAPKYGWSLYQKQWSKCNSICSGMQYMYPVCIELATSVQVENTFCEHLDIQSFIQKQECNTHCQLTWHIMSKSACSAHCGKGVRNVFYQCMKYINENSRTEIVVEQHCAGIAKPPEMETCFTVCNATRWSYSDWSECSKTCGGGLQRRAAKCLNNNIEVNDSQCNNTEKITEQICNGVKCPVWAAKHSSCSVHCGGGYQNITHYCHLDGQIRNPLECDQSQKPPDAESCNEQPCVEWIPTSWSPCSVTCNTGFQERLYICRIVNSQEFVRDAYCKHLVKPNDTKRTCYQSKCNSLGINYNDLDNNFIDSPISRFDWVADGWTACSKSCDAGIKYQIYICKNEFEQRSEESCHTAKPVKITSCNEEKCPKWKTGDWSQICDSNCEKHRQVRCINLSSGIVNDEVCDISRKPVNSTKCPLSECPHVTNTITKKYFDTKENQDKRYRWKLGRWKPCTNSCGKGTRRRHIHCEDSLNEIIVVDSLCNHLPKPKAIKPCERFNCKYAWIESYWSSCSVSCGQGVKTRNVTCHRVHHGGIVDPIPLPEVYPNKIHHKNYCSIYTKPPTRSKCLMSSCSDEFVWQPGDWKPCSSNCGRKGRQTRQLHCIRVKTKSKVPRHYCPKQFRPARKRKCNQWRCLPKSCKDIKYSLHTNENKDYLMSVKGRPVMIYCYKMDTSEPEEFISLHANDRNYAEIYDKRLIHIDTCPYEGERTERCQCIQVEPERSGITKFWKVRLNTTSLKIIDNDFTFSTQIKGTKIPFGTSGDCYSSVKGCPQGQFSIDLSNTSFKLSSKISWQTLGNNASSEIHVTGTTAMGKCGGYCGNCIPDPYIGLLLEIT